MRALRECPQCGERLEKTQPDQVVVCAKCQWVWAKTGDYCEASSKQLSLATGLEL